MQTPATMLHHICIKNSWFELTISARFVLFWMDIVHRLFLCWKIRSVRCFILVDETVWVGAQTIYPNNKVFFNLSTTQWKYICSQLLGHLYMLVACRNYCRLIKLLLETTWGHIWISLGIFHWKSTKGVYKWLSRKIVLRNSKKVQITNTRMSRRRRMWTRPLGTCSHTWNEIR